MPRIRERVLEVNETNYAPRLSVSRELDRRMRTYEASLDRTFPAGVPMVARLDGRGFTRLTKKSGMFTVPFDDEFHELMVSTTMRSMDCGFQVVYGYTQSDEISLLLSPDDDTFGRRECKYVSVLAGEASAWFTDGLGITHDGLGLSGCFDCRVVPLPTLEAVEDYFTWRRNDAYRNALDTHCYWMLRGEGMSSGQATSRLKGQPTWAKRDLLASHGIDVRGLPPWQTAGVGVSWGTYEKQGLNPVTGTTETAQRKHLLVDDVLPMGYDYIRWVTGFLPSAATGVSAKPAATGVAS